MKQLHSDLIHTVSGPFTEPAAGDGLITDQPGLLLGILTADCLPVIVADSKNKAIGIFHAGWRGTLKRIVEKGLAEMQRRFGTSPDNVRAAIGPGIHRCCYDVGAEVREEFHSQFDYAEALFEETEVHDPVREKYPLLFMTARPPGHGPNQSKISLDLVAANRRQLLNAGVAAVNIGASPLCTSCQTDMLFSHRAEHGVTGRMMAVAAIRAGR
ncbi:MAG: peptidoglycan editing factor PgeF [Acidobacteriales bacterium]|nr:peptidoglycan editing factor PgeF [Terriglobales bacterium]